jgi:GT2 family glycosyltransferase
MRSEVSIAILTYKRHDHVLRAIRSTRDCAAAVAETIVVDNAAEADLKEKIRLEFPEVRYIATPYNGGCEGRNIALRAAATPLLLMIDDDVEFRSPNAISEVQDAFERDPTLACLNFVVAGPDGKVLERDWCHPRPISHATREFETHFILEGACALRRDAVLGVGGYPSTFFLGHEGVDLAYRLIANGFRVVHTPRVSITHHAAAEERPGWRVYYYYTRNGIWVCYRSFPALSALVRAAAYASTMAFFAIRARQVSAFLRGCAAAVVELPSLERHCLDRGSLQQLRAMRAARVPLFGRIQRHLRERIL